LIAIPEGGWDALTCVRARMCGFETRLLTGLVVDHLKPRNIAEGGSIRRYWQMGLRDYALGYSLVFESLKCLGRLRASPLIIGSLAWWSGYCFGLVHRRKRLVPVELQAYARAEQWRRMGSLFRLRPGASLPSAATSGSVESSVRTRAE
jgi:hypothetical protein